MNFRIEYRHPHHGKTDTACYLGGSEHSKDDKKYAKEVCNVLESRMRSHPHEWPVGARETFHFAGYLWESSRSNSGWCVVSGPAYNEWGEVAP